MIEHFKRKSFNYPTKLSLEETQDTGSLARQVRIEACSSTEKRKWRIRPPIGWREIRHAVPPGASVTGVRWSSALLPSTTYSTPPRSIGDKMAAHLRFSGTTGL